MRIENQEQAEYWGRSASGAKWLTLEEQLDAALGPVADLVLNRAALTHGERVLDVGCGTGATTLMAARAVGPFGHVLAADIGEQLAARARDRIAAAGLLNAEIRLCDAQIEEFEPHGREAIISRFGMMFFSDPVAAFSNLAEALAPGGRMVFAAWGPLEGNPWFRIPFIAATTRLGRPPKTDRNAPGPLAFHDINRVLGLMEAAGLSEAEATTEEVSLTPVGSTADAAALLTRVGPAVRVIDHFGGGAEDARAIEADVESAITPFEEAGGVTVPATINLYSWRKPA
ncbi:class I SAM-dependent methyltransferase [Lutimaribacter marinistellae]|uniref:Class I SAM-dependent methyltransferase n=1 Tax=Lutimaribacter marinistellae TaxID=1820329 RepID=A0ABV7TQU1_9RHOB